MSQSGLILAQLILQYGIPIALQIWAICTKKTITDDDIKALEDIKPPSDYLVLTPKLNENL